MGAIVVLGLKSDEEAMETLARMTRLAEDLKGEIEIFRVANRRLSITALRYSCPFLTDQQLEEIWECRTQDSPEG